MIASLDYADRSTVLGLSIQVSCDSLQSIFAISNPHDTAGDWRLATGAANTAPGVEGTSSHPPLLQILKYQCRACMNDCSLYFPMGTIGPSDVKRQS